jgi:hypothetical protein
MAMSRPLTAIALAVICLLAAVEANRTPTRVVVTRNQLSAVKQTLTQNADVKNFAITIKGDDDSANDAYIYIAPYNDAEPDADVDQKLKSGRRLMSGGSSRRVVVARNQLSAVKQTLTQNANVKNFAITIKGDDDSANGATIYIEPYNGAEQDADVDQKNSGRRLMSGGSSRRVVVTRNQLSAVKQTLTQNADVKNFAITIKGDDDSANDAYIYIAPYNEAEQDADVDQKLKSGRRLMSRGSSRRVVVARNQLSTITQTLTQNANVKNFVITISGDDDSANNAYIYIAPSNSATQNADVDQKQG